MVRGSIMVVELGIIGGCGSSGTTLLTHLMSRSKYICSGPEFNCFNHPELYNFSTLKKEFPNMYAGKSLSHGYIDVGVFMTFRKEYEIDFNTANNWLSLSNDSKSFINLIRLYKIYLSLFYKSIINNIKPCIF